MWSGYTPASDVFALMVTAFEIITRAFPYVGLSHTAITDKARARFAYDESLFEDFGLDREAQMGRWMRRNPLAERRPDLTAAEEVTSLAKLSPPKALPSSC